MSIRVYPWLILEESNNLTAVLVEYSEKGKEDNSLCPLRTRRFFIDITYKFRYTVISHYPKPHTIHIPHHATGAGNYIGVLNLFLNRLSESRLDILRNSAKSEKVYIEAKSFVKLNLIFVQYQAKVIWDVGTEYYGIQKL